MKRRSFLGLMASTPFVPWTQGVELDEARVLVFRDAARSVLPFSIDVLPSKTALVRLILQRAFLPERLLVRSACAPTTLITHGTELFEHRQQYLPAELFSETELGFTPVFPFNACDAGDELTLGLLNIGREPQTVQGVFLGRELVDV